MVRGSRSLGADDSQGRCLFGEFPMPTNTGFVFGGQCHNASHTPLTPLSSLLFPIKVEHSEQKRREGEGKGKKKVLTTHHCLLLVDPML
jgi:hypothetical protein